WVSAGKVRNSVWRKRVWRTAGMARHRRMRYWMPACTLPPCTNRLHSVNVAVASWICSAVGDMKTCFLVHEGTWHKGGGAHAPRERPLAPGVLRRASPAEA